MELLEFLISSGSIWIFIFVFLFCAVYLFLVFRPKRPRQYREQPPREEKRTSPIEAPQYNITVPTREELEIREFWHQASTIANEYITTNDIASLEEFVYNVWTTRDKVESAVELHYFINHIVFDFYKFRYYSDKHYELINLFCDLDIYQTQRIL